MAYEKQIWNCGDTITAEKLQHMEDGIASGGGTEPLSYATLVFDSWSWDRWEGFNTYSCDVRGKFSGYEYFSALGFETDTDTETPSRHVVVNEVVTDSGAPNKLPDELNAICHFALANAMWKLFGRAEKDISYDSVAPNYSFYMDDRWTDVLKLFEGEFTISI